MDWSLPETYSVEVSERDFSGEALKGKYNIGYVVDDLQASDGDELFEDTEEYVLWTLLEENTPEIRNQEDLVVYHLARARNAEVMSRNGLNVPETTLVEASVDNEYELSFLVTPYIDHTSFEQRPKSPGHDMRRNNPHRDDPFDTPERRSFEASIDEAMQDIDDERLVSEGKIINAGDGGIDDHNKNWGLIEGDLIRLDIGEVPAEGPVWSSMPYLGPQQFYEKEGLREDARETLQEMRLDPEEDIPEEEARKLMKII